MKGTGKPISKIWGNVTWNLLHIIAEKCINSNFNSCKYDIFKIITLICNTLPCPICRNHAAAYISTHNLNTIRTKEELKHYLFTFHNVANTNTNKPNFDIAILRQYENLSLTNAFFTYMNLYKGHKSDNLSYGFSKILHLKEIHKLFIKNTNSFSD